MNKFFVWALTILFATLIYQANEIDKNRSDLKALKAKIQAQEKTPTYRIEVRECVDPWPDGDYRPLDEIRREAQ